jgi:hypothetical protein
VILSRSCLYLEESYLRVAGFRRKLFGFSNKRLIYVNVAFTLVIVTCKEIVNVTTQSNKFSWTAFGTITPIYKIQMQFWSAYLRSNISPANKKSFHNGQWAFVSCWVQLLKWTLIYYLGSICENQNRLGN